MIILINIISFSFGDLVYETNQERINITNSEMAHSFPLFCIDCTPLCKHIIKIIKIVIFCIFNIVIGCQRN